MGMHYTPNEPKDGFSPQQAILPSAEMERAGEVDWEATFANFSCVIGVIWRARKLMKPAYFDRPVSAAWVAPFTWGSSSPNWNSSPTTSPPANPA